MPQVSNKETRSGLSLMITFNIYFIPFSIICIDFEHVFAGLRDYNFKTEEVHNARLVNFCNLN